MEDQKLLLQEQILTLLREDRERGAELLLETYTPLLWTVCRRRLSDPEDIKECINDVFTSFCMNIDKFDPEQVCLKNYLSMIADRRAISYYRSNQRRSEAESAGPDRSWRKTAEHKETNASVRADWGVLFSAGTIQILD